MGNALVDPDDVRDQEGESKEKPRHPKVSTFVRRMSVFVDCQQEN